MVRLDSVIGLEGNVVDGWVDIRMYGWMDIWMDERMDEFEKLNK